MRRLRLSDGRDDGELFVGLSDQTISTIEPGPGARDVVLGLGARDSCRPGTCHGRDAGAALVIDNATGKVLFELDSDDPRLAGGLGTPDGEVWWRDDSSFFLRLSRHSGTLGSAYLVGYRSGDVTRLPRGPALLHPRTEVGVWFPQARWVGCYDWPTLTVGSVHRPDLGLEVAGGGKGLVPHEFSPDGQQLLVQARTWDVGPPQACNVNPSAVDWLVVEVATGAVQTHPTYESATKGWFGASTFGWICPTPAGRSMRGNREFSCAAEAGTLTLGSIRVEATSVAVLGLVP